MIENLNEKISKSVDPVFIFGAHVFTQYLLAFGLSISNVAGILDNDPLKQGKRLYGTKLNVFSPKKLAMYNSPKVILKTGIYNRK